MKLDTLIFTITTRFNEAKKENNPTEIQVMKETLRYLTELRRIKNNGGTYETEN